MGSIKLWIVILLISTLPIFLIAQIENPTLNIEETDGFPSLYPYKILVSTGTLTDNGDGTATLSTGLGSGGGSGGTFITTSTAYIQNTFTPNTTTQVFSVQQGSFSAAGYFMMDANNCRWQTTISTTGALVTTLDGCPNVITTAFKSCTRGMSLGILSAITCP